MIEMRSQNIWCQQVTIFLSSSFKKFPNSSEYLSNVIYQYVGQI